jgi:hypothetical protein
VDKQTGEAKRKMRTRELYRYPYVGITASAIWTASMLHCMRVRWVLTHHLARRSWVGIIPPMEPTIVGPRVGLREQGSVRVLGRGNRQTEVSVLAEASHHIGNDAVQPADFSHIEGLSGVRAWWCGRRRGVGHRALGTPPSSVGGRRGVGAYSRWVQATGGTTVGAISRGPGVGLGDGSAREG